MSLHAHHAAAVRVIAAAAVLDLLLGAAFGIADHVGVGNGLWFATVTATTVGYGDVTAHGWLPHLLAAVIMLSVIPLFGAAFSLFTSGLAASRTEESEDRIKQHVADRLEAHAQPGLAPKLDHLSGKVDGLADAVGKVMAARAERDRPAPATAEAVEHLGAKVDLVIRAVTPPAASAAAAPGPSPAAGGTDGEGAARRPSRTARTEKK